MATVLVALGDLDIASDLDLHDCNVMATAPAPLSSQPLDSNYSDLDSVSDLDVASTSTW